MDNRDPAETSFHRIDRDNRLSETGISFTRGVGINSTMQGRTAPEPSTGHGNFKRRRRTIETRPRRMRIVRTKADSFCPRRKEPHLWPMRPGEQRAMHLEEYALEDVPAACPHGLFDSDWNNGLRRRDHSKQFALSAVHHLLGFDRLRSFNCGDGRDIAVQCNSSRHGQLQFRGHLVCQRRLH